MVKGQDAGEIVYKLLDRMYYVDDPHSSALHDDHEAM